MNIYALSSGRGPSGIAIVRISGKDTLKVCKNLTKLEEVTSNVVNYCKLQPLLLQLLFHEVQVRSQFQQYPVCDRKH